MRAATETLRRARDVGLVLWLGDDGRVNWQGPVEAFELNRRDLVAHRDEIAVLLEAERLEGMAEAFEERAAIMEYDGGLSRTEAETLARIEIYGSP